MVLIKFILSACKEGLATCLKTKCHTKYELFTCKTYVGKIIVEGYAIIIIDVCIYTYYVLDLSEKIILYAKY